MMTGTFAVSSYASGLQGMTAGERETSMRSVKMLNRLQNSGYRQSLVKSVKRPISLALVSSRSFIERRSANATLLRM